MRPFAFLGLPVLLKWRDYNRAFERGGAGGPLGLRPSRVH